MPDRDQGWQKARDQARLAGCIVDMPRGQRWQTAMEQTDQAQGKQNCHWTKQGLHTAGNQVRPTAWIPNHTPWQRKDHSTTRQLDGGLGPFHLEKGWPVSYKFTQGCHHSVVVQVVILLAGDTACSPGTTHAAATQLDIHCTTPVCMEEGDMYKLAAFTTSDCTTSKAIICSKRWLHRDEVCFRGRQRVPCCKVF